MTSLRIVNTVRAPLQETRNCELYHLGMSLSKILAYTSVGKFVVSPETEHFRHRCPVSVVDNETYMHIFSGDYGARKGSNAFLSLNRYLNLPMDCYILLDHRLNLPVHHLYTGFYTGHKIVMHW